MLVNRLASINMIIRELNDSTYTFVTVDEHIEDVDNVTCVVECEPSGRHQVLHFPEDPASNDEKVIIHDGHADETKPLFDKYQQQKITK